ncbi:MAG TPA: SRPBCC family protein [Opitutaceae bacterium]|jgi:hypothetical protein
MRLVVRVVGAIVVLLVALALAGLFLPGRYHVSRSVVIAAPPSAIYPNIGDLKAWPKWGVWFARDPAMQIAYSPTTSAIGAWSAWTSKSQGNGRMTVTAKEPPNRFDYRLEFPDEGMVASGSVSLVAAGAGSTRVTAAMDGELGRSPFNRWFGFFMDTIIGPDFQGGLANLKRISEAPARAGS